MNLDTFEQVLLSRPLSEMVQQHLFEGIPYCFRDTPETFYLLRTKICDFFNIHPQNFTIVGSAKIGFSLSPKRDANGNLVKYGRPFSEASDIDVVLVSDELFQQIWLDLIHYKKRVVYRLDLEQKRKFDQLQYIVFYGSLRLDMVSNTFPFAKEWWEFFNRLSVDKRFGPRRVRAMIFKSWEHVSIYYEENLREIKTIRTTR